MDYAVPELDTVGRQLMSVERPPKTKVLVVDDERDNLDLLYRTFRRDFNVLKAESGVRALDLLAVEGEVAVIISDQRMPEMKGTEFLSRTVPQFPDTMRIILTGFTDVEDLVEAINSGQVYRYITKPWDPAELKAVVEQAAETYGLLKQRTEEMRRAQAKSALMVAILQAAQQAETLQDCLEPIAIIFSQSFHAYNCILQLVENHQIPTQPGRFGSSGPGENWLAQNSLAKTAIASQSIQVAVNIPADPTLRNIAQYADAGIEAHLIIPVLSHGNVVALLSLQWQHPYALREDELVRLHLAAQQVALSLCCAGC